MYQEYGSIFTLLLLGLFLFMPLWLNLMNDSCRPVRSPRPITESTPLERLVHRYQARNRTARPMRALSLIINN